MKKSLGVIKEFSVETVIDSKLNFNDLDELSYAFFLNFEMANLELPVECVETFFIRKAETLAVQVARKEASKKTRLI